MKLVEKKTEKVANLIVYNGSALYIDKSNNNERKLVYETHKTKLVFDEFNIGNAIVNDGVICCVAPFGKHLEYGSALLDEHFNVLKRFYNRGQIRKSTPKYYFLFETKEFASLDTDEIVIKLENHGSTSNAYFFNSEYYIDCANTLGWVYIVNLTKRSILKVDILEKYPALKELPEQTFRLAHVYHDRLVVFFCNRFLMIDINTGEIIYIESSSFPYKRLKVVDDVVYADASPAIAKYQITTQGLVQLYHENLQPSGDKNVFLQQTNYDLEISGKYLWATTLFGMPGGPLLMQFDANTGKRVKHIELRPFGIHEVFELAVSDDKIYISTHDHDAWVFEKEANEK